VAGPPTEFLKGTLDLMILKTLSWAPAHGYGIARWIEQCTDDVLQVEEGSLYPALYKLEENGLIVAEEDAVLVAPKSTHSRKPDVSYTLIERLCPGPYLELFARRPREGWTSWGNAVESTIESTVESTPPAPLTPAVFPDPGLEWPD